MHEHIGHERFRRQLEMLAAMPRVLMIANVKPGPAIEAAWLDMTNVIRNEVLAEFVPFIGTHPKLARAWAKCDANGVANSPGKDLLS